jgi:hypothetical protein
MLIAISETAQVDVVEQPRKMVVTENGVAVAGLPRVIDILNHGTEDPIWNLSDSLQSMQQDNPAGG